MPDTSLPEKVLISYEVDHYASTMALDAKEVLEKLNRIKNEQHGEHIICSYLFGKSLCEENHSCPECPKQDCSLRGLKP